MGKQKKGLQPCHQTQQDFMLHGTGSCVTSPAADESRQEPWSVSLGRRLQASFLYGDFSHLCLLQPWEEVTANLIPSSKQFWICQLPWQPHKKCVTFSIPRSSWGSLWIEVKEFNLETSQLASQRAPGYPPAPASLAILGIPGDARGRAWIHGTAHQHSANHAEPRSQRASPSVTA